MAAGRHGSAEVTFSIDDPTNNPRAMAAYLDVIGEQKIASTMDAVLMFGAAWEGACPTGVRKYEPFDVEGFFDDTATSGPHVVFQPDYDPQGAPRDIVVVFGNSKTLTGTCFVTGYSVGPKAGKLTRFKASIQPTSTATWS